MMIDELTVVIMVAIFNIITLIIAVTYCNYLIDKTISMLIDTQDDNEEPKKNIKKSPANIIKSKLAAKKKDKEKVNLLDKLFGLADDFIDNFADEEDDEDTDYANTNDDASDDEELDSSIAKNAINEEKKKPIAPLRETKVVTFDKPKMYHFTNPQDLVNYIANKDNRTIYDTKKNRIEKIKSFDVDYNGGLMIYYDYYDLPDYFEPGRFAKVS